MKNNDGHTQKNDITQEDNTEYELLFSNQRNNITLNGGLEFSRPKYKSDRITGGKQEKDVAGVFNQLAWRLLPTLEIVSGLRLD